MLVAIIAIHLALEGALFSLDPAPGNPLTVDGRDERAAGVAERDTAGPRPADTAAVSPGAFLKQCLERGAICFIRCCGK
jgi:hypothetical protein